MFQSILSFLLLIGFILFGYSLLSFEISRRFEALNSSSVSAVILSFLFILCILIIGYFF